MTLALPTPEIPRWAELAGIPPPEFGEGFRQYVTRLGYSFEELIEDLPPHPSLAPILNLRLASRLRRSIPEAFDEYVRRWIWQVRAGYSYDHESMEEHA